MVLRWWNFLIDVFPLSSRDAATPHVVISLHPNNGWIRIQLKSPKSNINLIQNEQVKLYPYTYIPPPRWMNGTNQPVIVWHTKIICWTSWTTWLETNYSFMVPLCQYSPLANMLCNSCRSSLEQQQRIVLFTIAGRMDSRQCNAAYRLI